VKEICANLDL
jgi:hypothetical protein